LPQKPEPGERKLQAKTLKGLRKKGKLTKARAEKAKNTVRAYAQEAADYGTKPGARDMKGYREMSREFNAETARDIAKNKDADAARAKKSKK
jgi:Sec7-like guanine-nucleotide exchange factor